MSMVRNGPSLKYPGAKWGSHGSTARWIVSQLPKHTTYVEPFFGSGGVFFNKPPSKAEYINDLNGDVVNLFRVMREQCAELVRVVELTPYSREEYELSYEPCTEPVERARRTLIQYWMSAATSGGRNYPSGWRHAGKKTQRGKLAPQEWAGIAHRIQIHAKRLKDAHIENRPALEVLGRLNHPSALVYVDPPYPGSTRSGRMYREEMLEDELHAELLGFLTQDWQGMAVVSGYAHPLYDDLLSDWTRLTRRVSAEQGQIREEVLWVSPNAAQRGLFS